jgi:dihydrofolate synthase / folylpolyglutamate synthase
MDYRATLDFLFAQLPMFSRLGAAAYKKDLHNILALCAALGNPQERFRSIHVAGTNGKGSVSHMLAAVLQESGYKTGLYTSPHLYDFRERIRINGDEIPEENVVRFTERIKLLIEELQPSFFEVTVAMAFEWFAASGVDIAVIEVGLGGRLDSTNIITPVVSVITNIGYDHMQLLGNTLPEIAGEKAGIIKERVPAIIGRTTPVTLTVFKEKASLLSAPLHLAQQEFNVLSMHHVEGIAELAVARRADDSIHTYTLDLPGYYQQENICTVLSTIGVLRSEGWALPEPAVKKALAHARKLTGLKGRWETIRKAPMVVLEVAHNPDGLEAMKQQLKCVAYNKLHIVFGMVRDKDPHQLLSGLPKNAHYYFTQAQIPRALPVAELQQYAQQQGLKGAVYSNVNEAAAAAIAGANADDLVIICGSIFLVAELDRSRFGE